MIGQTTNVQETEVLMVCQAEEASKSVRIFIVILINQQLTINQCAVFIAVAAVCKMAQTAMQTASTCFCCCMAIYLSLVIKICMYTPTVFLNNEYFL